MKKDTDGPDSQTDSTQFVAKGLDADPALAQAKERQRYKFGEFDNSNPAVFKVEAAWQPAKFYPKWCALTFLDEKDLDAVIKLIDSISKLRFAPRQILLSTIFLPEKAANTLLYVLGDDIKSHRVPKNVLTLKAEPEVTEVYHIEGLIPLLQVELKKKECRRLRFRATRPRPVTTKSDSHIFYPVVHVDDLVADLIRSNPVFKDWCRLSYH